jgi:hypothetical protein
MTTQKVANRYYELAGESNWTQVQDELHGDNVISREPDHAALRGVQVITEGVEAVKAKTAANREMIETIHSHSCSEPIVAGNFFSIALKRDVTFKGKPRMKQDEICVLQVTDGKIVSEQFFY